MLQKIYPELIELLSFLTYNEALATYPGERIIHHVAFYNHQDQYPDQDSPFSLPACLIEFPPIRWQHSKDGLRSTLTIRLHLVARTEQPDQLAQLLLRASEGLWLSLSGWALTDCSALTISSTELIHDYDELCGSIETYTCNIFKPKK